MFTCPVCDEQKDDTEAQQTPCCVPPKLVCTDCITGGGKDAMVRYQDSQYICVYCMNPVTDAHGYDGILSDQDINAILAAQAQQAQPVAQVTVADPTLRSNAWLFGAYTHSPGCGTAVQITEGCDVLKCPTCAVLINILGGEIGAHTFFAEAFFAAVKKFGAQTNAGQLQVLASEHSQVWAARFMDELIAGVRDGTRAGLVDSMDEQAWGGFLEFLRYRIAPQTVHINGTSLFALINSIGATSPDGALLSAHYHNVETKGLLEFMVVKARMEVVGQLTVPQVKQIVQAQAKGSAHWWTT